MGASQALNPSSGIMHMTKTAKTKSAKTKPRTAGKPVERSRSRQPIETKLAALKRRLLAISDLNFAGALLGWDQATYMPPGGAEARGRQSAMLSKLAHEKSVDPALGRLGDWTPPSLHLDWDPVDDLVAERNRR